MDDAKIQLEWSNLIESSNSEEIKKFIASDKFEIIKNKTTSIALLVKHYHFNDFDKVYFSLPEHILKEPILALKVIEHGHFDIENQKHLDYIQPFLENPLLALEAVKQEFNLYKLLLPEVKNELSIAMIAIEKDGRIYQYLPDELKNLDRLKMLAVNRDNNSGYNALSEEDKLNRTYLSLAKRDKNNYQFFSDSIKIKNKKMVLDHPELLAFTPESIKNDDSFVINVIRRDSKALAWAPEKFQRNEAICLAAYKNNKISIKAMHFDLLSNPDFCRKLLTTSHTQVDNENFWKSIDISVKTIDFTKELIKKEVYFLNFARKEIFEDRAFLLDVQAKFSNTFKNIPKDIKENNFSLMRDLCSIILNKRIDPKTKNTFKIGVSDFIRSFPMPAHKDIKEYLVDQKFNKFSLLLPVLDKLVLEQNLKSILEEKIPTTPEKSLKI